MTPNNDLLALAERCEAATADQQGRLIEEAWEAMARHSASFRRFAEAFVSGFDNNAGKFVMALEASAFESAALMLVPEGWNWMAGNRDQPVARAYVNNGESAFIGAGMRRNPDRRWFEMTAATPALALTAASLRALAQTDGR